MKRRSTLTPVLYEQNFLHTSVQHIILQGLEVRQIDSHTLRIWINVACQKMRAKKLSKVAVLFNNFEQELQVEFPQAKLKEEGTIITIDFDTAQVDGESIAEKLIAL